MTASRIEASQRAAAIAQRIKDGARALAAFVERLSAAEWETQVPGDGRTVGVIVHHVASFYPVEIEWAQMVATGKPVTGVTWEVIDQMNAMHAMDYVAVDKQETLDLLHRNSESAAGVTRALTDEELDTSAEVSLKAGAPMSTQFFVEDHCVGHSYHHLAQLRTALSQPPS